MKLVGDADRATAEASPSIGLTPKRLRFMKAPISSVFMETADMGFFDNRLDHAVNKSELPGQLPAGNIPRELVQAYTTAQVCVESLSGKVAYPG